MHSSIQRRAHLLPAGLLVLLATMLALGPLQSVFAASAALDVTIRTDFPVVASGDWAVVEVNYSCSSITSTPCADVVISSALPPELARAAGDVQVVGVGATTSYDPATATARWAFDAPINAGSTGTFELRVRFAPGSTPDGTVALLRAEIAGSNAAPDVSNQLALTARATPRARADKRFVSGGVLDLPTVYQLEVCVPNPGSGALDLSSVVLTDRLPAGATFVSASDGGVYDAGAGTVTWPATSILVSAGQSCARRTLTVTFADAAFAVGDEVRNDLSVAATALGGATLSLSDADVRLIQPPSPGLAFGKSGPAQAEVGATVRYNFTQRNTGTTALIDLSLLDQIPPELRVSRVYAAAHNQAAALRLLVEYQTDQSATWQPLPGAPFTAAACVNVAPAGGGGCASTLTLPAGAYITALRWTYLDPLPYGWQATGSGSGFEATVASAPVNQIIVNTGESRYTFNGYSVLDTSTARTRVVLNTPAARPSMEKAVDPAVVYAGGTLTYTLTLRNEQLAGLTTDLAGPRLADLLVPSLLYVDGSQAIVDAPAGAPTPQFQLTPDFKATGRQLLSWSWPGYSLPPGEELVVRFRARVAPFTAAGRIDNSAYLAGWANQPADILLAGCPATAADSYDFDGDGNTQEQLCRSTISSVSLAEAARSDSLKLVRGQLDSAWTNDPDTGLTVPGGQASYTLTITNTGTIPVHELVLVDILPWLGDTGVIRLDQQRETEWRPFLIEPIVGPSGSTVFYSTQANPCRQPDLGLDPDAPGCEPPAWSSVPPADLTAVQAFKIDFGGLVLAPDEAVTVGVRMRAPYAGEADETAWNSFAYRARELGTDDYLLAAEPPRVGIERAEPVPPGYGNFVWLDQDDDGLQDEGEPGVNGARVELFRDSDGAPGPSAGDTLVDWTLSGPHDDGRPGFYLFSHPDLVPPGAYYARFTPPAGLALVTPHLGADDAADSDADPATGLTPVTTLESGEFDLTWDAGLRATTAVGNYVWLDQNRNGVQDEPAGAGVNGVTVRLRRAADGSLAGATVTADDPAGRPGFYLFDELAVGDYYVEFALPAGFSFATRDQGDDGADSDADPATGRTAAFSLADGQYDATRDAGLALPPGSLRLGDRVWRDGDNDGRYEPAAGERGLDGVRLNLYLDANGNDAPDPGEQVGSTTTAGRLGVPGWYQFEGLPPGDYVVALDPANFAPGGPLAGLQSSTGNEPTPDPDDDRDHDDNGEPGPLMIASRAITLGGAEPTDDGDDASGNQTLDFGLASAALGNLVWFDADGDGLQDAGEPPAPGVTVQLLDADGDVLRSAVTDHRGAYGFGDLPAGSYSLRFGGLPAGHSLTLRDQGADDARDSDADPATGSTGPIALPAGALDTSWDAGLVAAPAGVGDRVWDDLDRDGVQDAGEPGLDGVAVRLFRADGTLAGSTVTAGGGLYAFAGLPPGDYYLEFGQPPAGYTPSPQNSGADDLADSDADTVTRRTAVTTLAPGEHDPSWDLGLFTFAGIGDRVWNDLDRDGVQDAGEGGVSGVAVRLYRPGSSAPVASTSTGSTGLYSFTNLIPGDYYLEFGLPTGYRPGPRDAGADDALDSDPSPTSFQTLATTLAPGEHDASWDFGIFRTASLGDRAWLDLDADGVQDPGEPGVPGVQVVLYDGAGVSVNSAVTDATGAYSFANLVPGDYSLLFVPPPSYALSPRDVGADDLDSDAFAPPERTALTTLDPGESDTSWDVGLFQVSSLGDLVWHDRDADGVQDGGEPGVPGVVVSLYRPGADGVIGGGDDVLVLTDTTDADGLYRFPGLAPLDYYVQFAMPAGYSAVSPRDSADVDDDGDSDVDPATLRTPMVTLPSSASDLSLDMGVYNLASLGDRVWLDANADGLQDAGETDNPGGILAGLAVELWRPGGAAPTATTATDATGLYTFTDLIPGDYYLAFHAPAGYALTRQDQGADAGDSDASPISGRTGFISLESGESDRTWDAGVFLPASVGDRVWHDQDADGVQDAGETAGVPGVRVELLSGATVLDYAYTDLDGRYRFTGLLPGGYQVRFGPPPAGHFVSPRDAGGDDAADSDADLAAGLTTAAFSVASGDDDRSHDLGLFQLASLGDRIWHDQDADGAQDAGEPGLAGVTVELWPSGAGAPLSTTTTLASGLYTFTNLVPGDYYVQFAMPAGYDAVSPPDRAAAGDGADSDADPITRRTATTSLASGESDPSWDMGVYRYASLGDRVWEDADGDGRQDAGEPGLDGVDVTLDYAGPDGAFGTGDDALAISTTVTAGGGAYGFAGLVPGRYRLTFGTLAGYERTSADSPMANDASDSDANATTGQTAGTVLVSGENDLGWDAGLYRPATLGNYVWEDRDGDGVQEAGEPPFDGVSVTLGYAGLDGVFGNADDTAALASATTGADGLYLFTDLRPGTYRVTFARPAGYAFTQGGQGADDELDSDVAEGAPASATTGAIPLPSGADDRSWDAGLYRLLSLGNLVWNDLNNNRQHDPATESGIDGVAVQLYRDSNGNGAYDAGADALVASTTTAGGGLYRFDGLVRGDYLVVIPASNFGGSNPLRFFRSSDGGAATDAALDPDNDLDGDDNGVGLPGGAAAGLVASPAVTLSPDAEPPASGADGDADRSTNLSVDFGFYSLTLGNLVWNDLNNNGLFDSPAESGINSRTVRLYYDANGDGAIAGTELSTAITSTTTSNGGRYLFGGLRDGGRYSVGVITAGGLWLSSTGGANAVPTGPFEPGRDVDGDPSDGDDNGTLITGSTVRSPEFVLGVGAEPTTETDLSMPTGVTNPAANASSNLSVDFGLFNAARIGDRVWLDADGDGVQDPGETTGFAGVTVRLYDSTSALISTTTTTAGGAYSFGALMPGSYSLEFAGLPAGYGVSPRDQGGDDGLDSDADPATLRTVATTLTAGEDDLSWDLGLYPRLSLGNLVWDDLNDNGLFDSPAESGIAGVTVELYRDDGDGAYDAGDTLVVTATTAAGGLYRFDGLEQGAYLVVVPASEFAAGQELHHFRSSTGANGAAIGPSEPAPDPDDDRDGDDNGSDPATGPVASAAIDLSPGAEPTADGDADPNTNLSLDFGFFQPLALGNLVWDDRNNDGLFQSASERGIGGVRVELYLDQSGDGQPAAGELVAFTTTDAAGVYAFDDLIAGSYLVVIPAAEFGAGRPLAGYVSSTGVNGAATGPYEGAATPDVDDVVVDGDDNGTTVAGAVLTRPISLARGLEPDVATDGDGTFGNQTADLGLFRPASLGDRVWHDQDADGAQDAGEPGVAGVTVELYDGAGAPISATTTLASGLYTFTNLIPGDYYVRFAMPAGYDAVSPLDSAAAGDAADSDADPATRRTAITSLSPGQSDSSWDMGVYRYASLGDRVWEDADGDGRQDAGEPGLDGVDVTLDYAGPDGAFGTGDDAPALATTVTAGGGAYSFAGLVPGAYRLTFGGLPSYARTAADDGAAGDAADSDADPATGRTEAITLISGEDDITWDAGLFRLLRLGDLVWEDQDNDGLYNPATEAGLDGVTVELYAEDATPGFGGGEALVASAVTAAGGRYQFADLHPGDYLVVIPAGQFAAGARLEGYASSTGVNGATSGPYEPAPDPDTDLDGDDNGSADGTGNVATAAVSLSLGGEPPAGDDGDGTSGNQTVDFGLFQPLALGDLVWEDLDNDGVYDPATERGLDGVTVELYAEDATPGFGGGEALVASAVTAAGGRYQFAHLHAGDYLVVIPAGEFAAGARLEGYESSTGASGAASGPYEPASDPDDNSADGRDNGSAQGGALATAAVTLSYGAEPDAAVDGDGPAANQTLDLGLFRPGRLGDLVWLDLDRDGAQDSGEPGVPGAGVTLLRPGPDGQPGTADDQTVATTVTGAAGDYSFEGLGAGEYFVRFGLPLGFERTAAGAGDAEADSDADPATGDTGPILIEPGSDDRTWDAGLIYAAGLGNRVWLDRDADGVQDAGEPGVAGVTVTLRTGAGLPLDTALTDAGGFYGFPHLPPGDYMLSFELPAGYLFSPAGRGGNPEADSDADPATGDTAVTTLVLGEADPSWDAGIFEPVGLGDLVWEDADNDGLLGAGERGLAGVQARLFADADGDGAPDGAAPIATTVTDADGRYGFEGLWPGRYMVEIVPPAGYVSSTGANGAATGPYEPAPSPEGDRDGDDNGGATGAVVRSGVVVLLSQGEPDVAADGDGPDGNRTVDFGLFRPAALGSTVWYDRDGDGRGGGEVGVPGVLVSLYHGDGAPVRDGAGRPITAVTDGAGRYLFDHLVPGPYLVRFSGLPGGYTFTTPNVGDGAGDSDADPLTGRTAAVTLAAGERNMSLWAGLINPTAISLISFTAERQGEGVALRWATGAEWGSWGFHILRSADGTRAGAVRITPALILARGGPQLGAAYAWLDAGVAPGATYTYWLQEVETGGATREYGPVAPAGTSSAERARVFLPLVVR